MTGARSALLALGLIAACAPPPPRAAAPVVPAPVPASEPRAWRFEVTASPGARELSVEAVIVAPAGEALGVEGAGSFLSGVEVSAGGPFQPLAPRRDAAGDLMFVLPPCPPEGCRVRYRFALAEAARKVGEIGCAEETHGAFLTSPSAWLLHPC